MGNIFPQDIAPDEVLVDRGIQYLGLDEHMVKSTRTQSAFHIPTSPLTALAIGGMDVNNTVIVPNKLIDRLDNAAALGSDLSKRAVATAEELAPRVTPRVT